MVWVPPESMNGWGSHLHPVTIDVFSGMQYIHLTSLSLFFPFLATASTLWWFCLGNFLRKFLLLKCLKNFLAIYLHLWLIILILHICYLPNCFILGFLLNFFCSEICYLIHSTTFIIGVKLYGHYDNKNLGFHNFQTKAQQITSISLSWIHVDPCNERTQAN